MRISAAALALLLADTRAFVPAYLPSRVTPMSKNQKHTSSLLTRAATTISCPTPRVTSTTPILADSDQVKNIMEARRCILEIDLAADRARDYLTHLHDMRQAISEFVKDPSTSLSHVHLPCLHNDQDVSLYQKYIREEASAAVSYLDYLVDLRRDILPYIQMYEQELQAGIITYTNQAHEATPFMQDLEETVCAAKEYLGYLQYVSGLAQQYLLDPQLNGIEMYTPVAREAQATRLLSIHDFINKDPVHREKEKNIIPEALQRSSWSKSNMDDSTKMAMAMEVGQSNEHPHDAFAATGVDGSHNDGTNTMKDVQLANLDHYGVPAEPIDWSQFKAPTRNEPSVEEVTIQTSHETTQPAKVAASHETSPNKVSFIMEETPPFVDLDQEDDRVEPLDWSQLQPNQMNSDPGSVFQTKQPESVSAIHDVPIEDSIIVEDSPSVNSYWDQQQEHSDEPIDWSQFKAPQTDIPVEASAVQSQVLNAVDIEPVEATEVALMNEDEFVTEESPSVNIHENQIDCSTYQTFQTNEMSVFSPEIETDYINMASKVKELLRGKDAFLREKDPSMQLKRMELTVPEPIDWSQFKAEHPFEQEVIHTEIPNHCTAQPPSIPSSTLHMEGLSENVMKDTIDWSQFKAPQVIEQMASDSTYRPDLSQNSHDTASSMAYMEELAKSLSSMAGSSIEEGAPTPSFENVATFENTITLDRPGVSSTPVQSIHRVDMEANEAASYSISDMGDTSSTVEIDSIVGVKEIPEGNGLHSDFTDLDGLAATSHIRADSPKKKPFLDMNDVKSRIPVLGGARLQWAVSFDSLEEPQQKFSLRSPDVTMSLPSGTTKVGALKPLYSNPNDVVCIVPTLGGAKLFWAVQFSSTRDPAPSFSLQIPEAIKPSPPSNNSKKARKSRFVDMNDVVSYIPNLGGANLGWAVQFWPHWDEEPQVDDDCLSNSRDAAIASQSNNRDMVNFPYGTEYFNAESSSSASYSSSRRGEILGDDKQDIDENDHHEPVNQEQPSQQRSNLPLGKSHRAKRRRRRLFVSKKKLRQRLRLISTSYFWKTKRQLEKDKAPTSNDLPVGAYNRTRV